MQRQERAPRRPPRPSWHRTEAEREVLVALRRIIRATDLHSKRLAREAGLTTPQAVVMQAIAELGEVAGGRVSAAVELSHGTVTTILDRLEARGLIERRRSVTDRRVVHARLTAAGRRALKQAPPLLQARFLDRFAALAGAEQARIVEALKQVAEMMGAGALDAAPLLDLRPPAPGARRRYKRPAETPPSTM